MINYQEQKNSMHCNYAFYFGATNDNSKKLGFLKTLMVVVV